MALVFGSGFRLFQLLEDGKTGRRLRPGVQLQVLVGINNVIAWETENKLLVVFFSVKQKKTVMKGEISSADCKAILVLWEKKK